ncbi:hypothetical protein LTS10_010270 [Elasticomyces elasticus]|nr:hypothetical protein LTS10_010270 [Elasticomyces elasticus]
MPRKVTHKAWAVNIEPAMLATHLAAEVRYKPLIDALRECEQSKSAHISNVPAELVSDITVLSHHLLAEKIRSRNESRELAQKAEKCWKGSCCMVDHLPKDEAQTLEYYFAEKHDLHLHDFEGLSAAQDHINEYLDNTDLQQILDDGIITTDWRAVQASNPIWYQEMVGQPGSGAYGVFTKYKDFLLENYGLEVWAQFEQYGDCCYRAEAYLILPSDVPDQTSTGSYNLGACPSFGADGQHHLGNRCDAEAKADRAIRPPTLLSSAEKATFARAMGEMGLKSCLGRYLGRMEVVTELEGFGPGRWIREAYGERWLNLPAQYRRLSHIYR